jgi:hypothetical protein
MSLSPRRLAAALGLALLLAAMGKASFTVQVSSMRDGFYELHDLGILLDMPDCLHPCLYCDVFIDIRTHEAVFADRACAIERAYREMVPVLGRYDIWLTRRGRDLYATRIGGWLIETGSCPVDAAETETRVVIDRRDDRLLIVIPEHPQASITGRVTCSIRKVYSELLF